MSVYKKINRETGEEALRYIVYEGDDKKLVRDVSVFHMIDSDLRDWGFYHFVQSFNGASYLIIIYEDMIDISFCTKLDIGCAILPFYFEAFCDDGSDCEIKFDKSRTYTPEELEALYPSSEYDTVGVKRV